MTNKEKLKIVRVAELKTARARIEYAFNNSEIRKEYGDESAPVLWYSKGIRDACWAIDDLIEEIERS